MLAIACLHTAASNVAVFDAALGTLPVAALELRHTVQPDLLRDPDESAFEAAARAALAHRRAGRRSHPCAPCASRR